MTIGQAFKDYSIYAFRMETYPIYRVNGEWDDYQHYIQTSEIRDNLDLKSFIDDIRKKVQAQKRHIRVRVLPDTPNKYIEFETKIGYVPQNSVGAELNFISNDDYLRLENPYSLIDFWLFDDTLLFSMKYEENGSFIGIEEIKDRDVIESAIRMKNTSILKSKTITFLIDEYLEESPN